MNTAAVEFTYVCRRQFFECAILAALSFLIGLFGPLLGSWMVRIF